MSTQETTTETKNPKKAKARQEIGKGDEAREEGAKTDKVKSTRS